MWGNWIRASETTEKSHTISLESGPVQWLHLVGGGAVALESAMDVIEPLSVCGGEGEGEGEGNGNPSIKTPQ